VTRIDFYLDADDRLQVACRVAAKAHSQAHKVLIYAPDGEIARAIDRLLWTTPATGFVPHVMASDRLAAETPVLLTADAEAAPWYPVLVNLGDDTPAGFARFERLIELVGAGEAERAAARSRWRFYRDRGYALTLHDMATADAER
jgi:DNA polymerase-3 subunit chi